jgi:hypothetical protein
LQHGLDGGSAGQVDQIVAGHLALRDQIYHGQKRLPVLDQEAGQFLVVDFPLLADGAVSFLHGGSPCKRLATRFFQNRVEPPLNFQLQPGHPRREVDVKRAKFSLALIRLSVWKIDVVPECAPEPD